MIPPIRSAAVIGAGTMGAAIAAHLANAGIPVVLLDRAVDGTGPTLAERGVARALKARPPAFHDPAFASRIRTGTIEDELEAVAGVDWVCEAIVEDVQAKRALWSRVAPLVGPDTILSSNSSGIRMAEQSEGLPDEIAARFVGTHFFNPPRVMRLLEVVPLETTRPEVVERIVRFGRAMLGKGIVVCRDVPGFVANRIAVHGLARLVAHAVELGVAPDIADRLTGTLIGRAPSGAFRTIDLSGVDVFEAVTRQLDARTEHDYPCPDVLTALVERGRLGLKTGAGFYRRGSASAPGARPVFECLDYATLDYRAPSAMPDGLADIERETDVGARIRRLIERDDKHGALVRRVVLDTLDFAVRTWQECCDDIGAVDDALRWGYGWTWGPVALIGDIGLDALEEAAKREGRTLATDVSAQAGRASSSATSSAGVGTTRNALLDTPRGSLGALDGGVGLLEIGSRLGVLDNATVGFVREALARAEASFDAVVITGRDGFSAGADLAEVHGASAAGDFERVDALSSDFQAMVRAVHHASVPVVAAARGRALGGGCELALHCHRVVAHVDLSMGLPEASVGVLPAGGANLVMIERATRESRTAAEARARLLERFVQMVESRVAWCAPQARTFGYLQADDPIVFDPDAVVERARREALALAKGFRPAGPRTVTAHGRDLSSAARMLVFTERKAGRYDAHDAFVAETIADVLAGTTAAVALEIDEDAFYDVERAAFVELCRVEESRGRMRRVVGRGG